MTVWILHLFCDGVLAETKAFTERADARRAEQTAYLQVAGAMVVDGQVIDPNGAVWTAAIEGVTVE